MMVRLPLNQPTYERVYVETDRGRFEFDYNDSNEDYRLVK